MSWLRGLLFRMRARPTTLTSAPRADDESGVAEVLERAIAAHRARRWETAEPLFRWVIEAPAARATDRQVARNILGNLLERTRRVDAAVEAYEANILEGFIGSYPYERLAAIYRRRQQPDDELRVLRRAVAVVERELASGRPEVVPQLERLQAELAEALERQGLSAADEPRG
jgi:hypothetical protein